MEVIQQDKYSIIRIANSFKNSNTFILMPDECDKAWIIDIGDSEKVLSIVEEKRISGIFLTHAHLDHIYGIKKVLEKFPDCIVYGSRMCLEYLLDDRKNLSLYYECPLELSINKSQILLDNSFTQIHEDISLQCIYTPGHTLDSCCYLTDNLIFTGDAYIPGIPTVTKLRGGNKLLASESISLIKSKINPLTIILPGHGALAYS